PVRHIDHVTPFAEGGETSLGNGQGLCVRCNHAKQAPGWRQKTAEIDGRHAVETVAPTGHTYTYLAPTPPEPAQPDGRVPRSRYSIGCPTPHRSGTVSYRPPGRRRTPRRRRPADLSWAPVR
ncbi:HNH endonuclease, partial [Promicromonospora soli]|uniref:HNH endonuclease n=1 Tax=Promicromonospora soli TaxID=2035533 RepID=UPI001677D767